MSLYAQHGYGKGRKIDLAILNGDIAGIILSPKAETPEKLIEFTQSIFQNNPEIPVLFDPQFFVCKFQGEINSGKLSQYPYYKCGLTRTSLSVPSRLHDFTESVISFQNQLNVSSYLSPTIAIDDFSGRDSQIAISFAYESIYTANNKDLFISLCIHEEAFRNSEAMEEFLNVISLFDVSGFYIIIERESNTAKATDIDSKKLSNIMKFIYILSIINQYKVIVGYSDMLSIPLAAVSNAHFACGWYSNLKSFSENNYKPSSGGRRPRKRYTSGALMNALLLLPEITTLNQLGMLTAIMSQSPYNANIYPTIKETAWTDEVSCLHNWHVINNELNALYNQETISLRLDLLESKISQAATLYRQIDEAIPFLDSKSNSSHLGHWKTAIENFRNEMEL